MGMTIDEAINTLEYIKNNPTNDVDAQLLPEAIKLFDTAIDTMRKYQKIKHIINDVPYLDKDEYKIASIKEIIDENDD